MPSGNSITYIFLGKLAGFKSNAERLTYMSTTWHNLSQADQQSCKEEAARLNENSPDLTEDEKIVQIKHIKKKLINNIMQLEQLGVESSNIVLDKNGHISFFGSRRGIEYLSSAPQIDFEFRKFFDVKEKEKNFSYKDLQTVFNEAYAKAINCKNAKVPYLKGNFYIEGIPDNIPRRKENGQPFMPALVPPSSASSGATCNNMTSVAPPTTESDNAESEAEAEESHVNVNLPVCMLKVVDEEVGKRVLNGGAKIQETGIDILNNLRKGELAELQNRYNEYFTQEALHALTTNYNSLQGSIIFATYTENPRVFWLFYYEGIEEDIENLSDDGTVPGCWLDKKKGRCYHFLSTPTSIKKKSIIKDTRGHVIAWKHKIDEGTKQLAIDNDFLALLKKTIRK
eukprot:gene2165-2458_t